ncbi:MAG TPA: alpha/beta fold hydrolase [Solirubrobacteraceae bacterium]|jgi:pimeloyl-ACP methyl ester carboxylesterase
MPTIDLAHGTVRYRVTGPEHPTAPPVVFVHGFLVNGSLWTKTADALAEAGVRSYAPDWPLGSHTIALGPGADQSPRGVARQIVAFLEALELDDVTLVGNDTGGAICQFLIDSDASRIGRVVLTNCDAFDNFPPAPFGTLFKAFRNATAIRGLMAPMRATAVRHSPAGFGLLVREPLDDEQTRAWVQPCLTDAGIREDVARFAREVDPEDLLATSRRLGGFAGPSLLVWGTGDRFFKLDFARRLRDAFAHARLVEIDGARTFVPHDHPGRLATEIAAFQVAGT